METSATLSTMERVLFLRQVPLFVRLEPEDLQSIAEISVERFFEPGDALVREGEIGDELFVIVEGSVRVTKHSNGDERLLRRLSSGDHLGELAILREQPRSATAVAEDKPVRVLALRGDALTAILEERPGVSLAMLSSLAERLGTLA
jgi:CRP-like cAMP-binding protein